MSRTLRTASLHVDFDSTPTLEPGRFRLKEGLQAFDVERRMAAGSPGFIQNRPRDHELVSFVRRLRREVVPNFRERPYVPVVRGREVGMTLQAGSLRHVAEAGDGFPPRTP